jgi:hypothetical protein
MMTTVCVAFRISGALNKLFFDIFFLKNKFRLSRSILILGIVNLILAPAIFVWQLLQFLYNNTEVSFETFLLYLSVKIQINFYNKIEKN